MYKGVCKRASVYRSKCIKRAGIYIKIKSVQKSKQYYYYYYYYYYYKKV